MIIFYVKHDNSIFFPSFSEKEIIKVSHRWAYFY